MLEEIGLVLTVSRLNIEVNQYLEEDVLFVTNNIIHTLTLTWRNMVVEHVTIFLCLGQMLQCCPSTLKT